MSITDAVVTDNTDKPSDTNSQMNEVSGAGGMDTIAVPRDYFDYFAAMARMMVRLEQEENDFGKELDAAVKAGPPKSVPLFFLAFPRDYTEKVVPLHMSGPWGGNRISRVLPKEEFEELVRRVRAYYDETDAEAITELDWMIAGHTAASSGVLSISQELTTEGEGPSWQ